MKHRDSSNFLYVIRKVFMTSKQAKSLCLLHRNENQDDNQLRATDNYLDPPKLVVDSILGTVLVLITKDSSFMKHL